MVRITDEKISQRAIIIQEVNKRIYASEFKTMREVKNIVWDILKEYGNIFEFLDKDMLVAEFLTAYIINCSVMKIVTVTGYEN